MKAISLFIFLGFLNVEASHALDGRNAFPFIQFPSTFYFESSGVCTAVKIDVDKFLTAKHCFERYIIPQEESISETSPVFSVDGARADCSSSIWFNLKFKRFRIHPAADIALVTIWRNEEFDKLPISKIPTFENEFQNAKSVLIGGYGEGMPDLTKCESKKILKMGLGTISESTNGLRKFLESKPKNVSARDLNEGLAKLPFLSELDLTIGGTKIIAGDSGGPVYYHSQESGELVVLGLNQGAYMSEGWPFYRMKGLITRLDLAEIIDWIRLN